MSYLHPGYEKWHARKISAMKRPRLDCECPNDGRSTFIRGCCDLIVCGQHQRDEHSHLEHPTTAELMAGVRLDGFLVEGAPIALVMEPGDLVEVTGLEGAGGMYRVTERTGASSYEVMPVDEQPEVGEAATQSPIGFSAMLADLDEGICIECGRLRYEHRGRHCLPKRSWLSRIWRYIHG